MHSYYYYYYFSLRWYYCYYYYYYVRKIRPRPLWCICMWYIYIYIYNIYTYIYIYIYIYIYTHTHTCMHTYIHTYIHVNVCSDEKTPASKLVQRGDSFMLQRPEYIITNICKCSLGTGYSSTKMKHGLSMRFSQFDTAVSLDRAQPSPLCGIERLRHTYANNPMIRNIGQV